MCNVLLAVSSACVIILVYRVCIEIKRRAACIIKSDAICKVAIAKTETRDWELNLMAGSRSHYSSREPIFACWWVEKTKTASRETRNLANVPTIYFWLLRDAILNGAAGILEDLVCGWKLKVVDCQPWLNFDRRKSSARSERFSSFDFIASRKIAPRSGNPEEQKNYFWVNAQLGSWAAESLWWASLRDFPFFPRKHFSQFRALVASFSVFNSTPNGKIEWKFQCEFSKPFDFFCYERRWKSYRRCKIPHRNWRAWCAMLINWTHY